GSEALVVAPLRPRIAPKICPSIALSPSPCFSGTASGHCTPCGKTPERRKSFDAPPLDEPRQRGRVLHGERLPVVVDIDVDVPVFRAPPADRSRVGRQGPPRGAERTRSRRSAARGRANHASPPGTKRGR